MATDIGNLDLNIVDAFLDTFIRYIDSGFGLVSGDVGFLTTALIGIDVTLAALWWAMDSDADILGKLVRKVLYVGAFAFILGNFSHLADIIYRSFAGIGITASGGGMSADKLLHPGSIAGTGFTAAHPLIAKVADLMGFPEFFGNFLTIIVLLICWLLVVLAFFVLAIQLFVTIVEFKLTALAGFVLVPFALWNKTSFLAERVLGNVVSSGIKVMVLAVIIGIGSNYFDQMTALVGDDPTVAQALTLLMGALTLFGLGIFGPGIASGLVSGAPQLGAGAAVGTAAGAAIMTGGAAMLGARATMAAGSGGMAAIRAGTAMGSAASTAYKLGQETSGSASVGAGLGGIATAAGGAASQGMRSAASSITSPIRESAARGQQAAWDSARTSPAPASAGASGSASGGAVGAVPSDSVPAWARNLRAEQTARHRRHLAMQTVKDGDRGGGAANPDLSEKE
ncbi:MAG: P-type conjugative transfer protein TrbL [Sphingomonas sp. 66-10]|uniref:P-type conjugative transfer protein TrbL n=1 Tax=Sphingomonas sp. 66-10 TaxID=1895848 RepID=UPI00086C015B|nr:P-type conjugative transfer protein TrbL [Sphingomonas sp. 66-10]ODU68430.1 MAG: P-type conjugative transfer protein TrbL [Novosphingobium sp. SCN 66-18]OJU18200.1 MAG: P-type conjugative transfer protein TrbL [Sphingomonas sp. 66-10]